MRNFIESLRKLSIQSKHFLQYFFLNSLNDSFKNQMVQITNYNYPSLDHIVDKLFLACKRLKQIKNVKGSINKKPKNFF